MSKTTDNGKKDWWDKGEILLKAAIPLMAAFLLYYYDSRVRDREVNVKYVEVAIGILKAPPDQQTAHLRDWAIAVVDKHSGLPFTQEQLAELRARRLPGVLTDESGRVLTNERGEPLTTE